MRETETEAVGCQSLGTRRAAISEETAADRACVCVSKNNFRPTKGRQRCWKRTEARQPKIEIFTKEMDRQVTGMGSLTTVAHMI